MLVISAVLIVLLIVIGSLATVLWAIAPKNNFESALFLAIAVSCFLVIVETLTGFCDEL